MIWSVKFSNANSQHSKPFSSDRVSPDGQLLASCSDDTSIKLWNVATGQCLKTFQDSTP